MNKQHSAMHSNTRHVIHLYSVNFAAACVEAEARAVIKIYSLHTRAALAIENFHHYFYPFGYILKVAIKCAFVAVLNCSADFYEHEF